jgi:DNA polymerase III subunit epsilon
MAERPELPLSQVEVLVLDCQATAAAPRGSLLEIGWARSGATLTRARTRLIALPDRERIPPEVARITGISERMARDGVDARVAWRELTGDASAFSQQPAPTVVHFARFEQPFLRALAGGPLPLDLICTHDIARRLLPDLPRRSLRALTGYFGRSVGALRRSAEHVEATAFVWRELVRLLEADGITTWTAMREWLAAPVAATMRSRRVWPIARDLRLSVPDAPGIYRLLRTSGDVLYVGKAASLRHRVNSYFRHQHGVPERMLEMLSQVRGISFEVAGSALEAALLEPDEIKRHNPPYNIALTADRAVWFAPADLSARCQRPSSRCPVGPFPSADLLDRFAALAGAHRGSVAHGRWGPDESTFAAGYARLCAAHPELSRHGAGARTLLRLGTRLWREGRRDRDADVDGAAGSDRRVSEWTPELVQLALERLALRAALARRRALWLVRLVDATVVWRERGGAGARLLIVDNGEITARAAGEHDTVPPVPAGCRRSLAERQQTFSVARFDRLRVLTTELRQLARDGGSVSLRFGVQPALAGARLASVLSWV